MLVEKKTIPCKFPCSFAEQGISHSMNVGALWGSAMAAICASDLDIEL
jgi:hypothetical protein